MGCSRDLETFVSVSIFPLSVSTNACFVRKAILLEGDVSYLDFAYAYRQADQTGPGSTKGNRRTKGKRLDQRPVWCDLSSSFAHAVWIGRDGVQPGPTRSLPFCLWSGAHGDGYRAEDPGTFVGQDSRLVLYFWNPVRQSPFCISPPLYVNRCCRKTPGG